MLMFQLHMATKYLKEHVRKKKKHFKVLSLFLLQSFSSYLICYKNASLLMNVFFLENSVFYLGGTFHLRNISSLDRTFHLSKFLISRSDIDSRTEEWKEQLYHAGSLPHHQLCHWPVPLCLEQSVRK